MKVTAITLRPGNVIDRGDGKLWVITKHEIMQPGKGAAVMQVEMRDVRSGNKDNVRYRTQETVERVRLEQDDYQFMYAEGDTLHLMHLGTYEQIAVPRDLVGEAGAFLAEGMTVEIESHEGAPLSARLPDTVTLEIAEAEPVVKGQTATTSYKPAVLENGVKVMVPPHIEPGTRIVVRTADSTYVERARD
ncbi:MAG TPA: elongation factor P [Rhodospirillaceae bacterium]|jgi:elongation factor P|nr:elongation factor P [Alphaproteobacteria bacterium]HBH27096.1 elongation factor P [Rhodospirillaceae bacterium]